MIWLINPITLLLVYILYTKTSGIYRKIITLIGAPLDFIVNVTWFTVVFTELPRELLLTKRVNRLKSSLGYRGVLAKLLCKLLNYFEKDHCK